MTFWLSSAVVGYGFKFHDQMICYACRGFRSWLKGYT